MSNTKSSEPAVVIGNGQSRKRIDLAAIPWTTFGCNGIVTEFVPTYLLCNDGPALEDLHNGGYEFTPPPKRAVDYGFGSCGGAALHSACFMGFDPVYLLGFDGGHGNLYPGFGTRKTRRVGSRHHPSRHGPFHAREELWRIGFQRSKTEYPGTDIIVVGRKESFLHIFPHQEELPWLATN